MRVLFIEFPTTQFRFNIIAMAMFGVLAKPAAGEDWFNPNFLSKDAGAVADLSRFENGAGQAPGVYRVDIWLNDEFITTTNIRFDVADGKISLAPMTKDAPADNTGLRPCLTVEWLKRLGLEVSNLEEAENHSTGERLNNVSECLDISHIFPGATSRFDFSAQKLFLSFPQGALHNNVRGYIPPEQWDEGVNAMLLNYSFTGDHDSVNDSYYLNLNSGVNIGSWRLRNNGTWNYTEDQNGYQHQSRWQNISTYIQRTLTPLKSELIIGDNNSGSDVFDSVGFRGVRVYSSESMYPDSQQGYAPTIRGVATARSKVTVRQNGYVIYQNIVQTGAFEIKDLNPTTSSGDLEVIVEADDGTTQHFTVPYSTVPLLQREGHQKYEIISGRYRSGNSNKNAPFFIEGTIARGFGKGFTIYGGIQMADCYKAAAVGIGRNIGFFGAVSADVTNANSQLADGSEYQGQSLRFLYAKSLHNLGTNFQLLGYRYSTKGFYTLDDVAWNNIQGIQYDWKDDGDGRGYHQEPISYHDLRRSKKGRLQVNISQQLWKQGSLYITGNRQTYWNSPDSDTWYQAGFSSSWHGISYNFSWSVNHTSGIANTNRMISLSVSIPFGNFLHLDKFNNMYATAQASRNQDGISTVQTGVSGTLLKEGNLSYNVMQGHNSVGGSSSSVNASLRGTYGTVNVGYSNSTYGKNLNWGVSGSLIAHADGITLSQSLGDTNVLIKAPGAKGVQVENATGIKTDWRGYAVMPYATPYRRNRVALDVNSLDTHTDLEGNVQSVVPTEGALVRAEYKTHTGIRALLTLLHHGHHIPFGTIVSEKGTGSTGIVDDTGQVYLTGIPLSGVLDIAWGRGANEQCRIYFALPSGSEMLPIVQQTLYCGNN